MLRLIQNCLQQCPRRYLNRNHLMLRPWWNRRPFRFPKWKQLQHPCLPQNLSRRWSRFLELNLKA
jgi:hypothetical protein